MSQGRPNLCANNPACAACILHNHKYRCRELEVQSHAWAEPQKVQTQPDQEHHQ
uniref:Uncharacterized protein n=1 Tax=Setaria italica TaxID=4555 RepID=K3YFA2_SETIT